MGLHKISAIEVYIICCTNRFPLSHKGGEGKGSFGRVVWEEGVCVCIYSLNVQCVSLLYVNVGVM